jgi:hypothetical protein
VKLGHFVEMVGKFVITRRQAEAARFLKHEFFLYQRLDQVAFDVETFDHVLSHRSLQKFAVTLDFALVLDGEFALANAFAVDFSYRRAGPVAKIAAPDE